MHTSFTDLMDCDVPLQLAPMSGIGTLELLTAVADAGGMAMIAAVMMPPAALEAQLDAFTRRSDGPVGVNFLLVVDIDAKAIEVAAARSRYVDFYHADVDPELVRMVHGGGALAGWQVNSVAQARAAQDAGCDLVVVRGVEGGGRMYGDRPLRPLLDEVIEALDVPVLAAGGLATREDVAECLALGAAGVRMGTRFIATEESGAHPIYKQAIVAAAADDAIVTDAFSVGLPQPGAAGVLRSAHKAAQASIREILGQTLIGGQPTPVPRLSPFPPIRETTGNLEAMALYAGRSAGAVTSVEPAGAIVRAFFDQARCWGSDAYGERGGDARLVLRDQDAPHVTPLTVTGIESKPSARTHRATAHLISSGPSGEVLAYISSAGMTLSMIPCISSCEKARKVWVRMLP